MLHLVLIFADQGAGHGDELIIHRRVLLLLRGQGAAEVLLHHGDGPGDEVAQVIGQVRVDGIDQQLVGEVADAAEGERAQQEEAQRINAVALGQQIGIDDIALGFGHLAAVQQ